jgi:methionine-rich copper-binding protein CopC
MKKSKLVCAALLLVTAGVAHARLHAHLKEAMPSDGSVVAASPTRLALRFSEAARLTAAWIQKEGDSKRKLELLPREPATQISVALPSLAPGRYVVSWRVVGDDGHIVPGQLHFTVAPAKAASRTAPP